MATGCTATPMGNSAAGSALSAAIQAGELPRIQTDSVSQTTAISGSFVVCSSPCDSLQLKQTSAIFTPALGVYLTMPLPKYTYTGPIDHTVAPELANAKGKSVIITGGANGMGEAMVRAFSAAGAFVTFGDLHPRGEELANELNAESERTAFVKCDIRDWDAMITLFETAKNKSPHNSVDVVIANAGISRGSGDSLWNLDGKSIFTR